jgi:hypothetical protein
VEQVPDAEKPVPISAPEAAAATPKSGLFENADVALKAVHESYGYWSGKFNETSLQMCYALIAANWLIFGPVPSLLNSQLAKWSLLMPMLAIGTSVGGSWWLSESLNRQAEYGETHAEEWTRKFKNAAGKKDPFPYTEGQQNTGHIIRRAKAAFLAAGSILLVIGAILK